MTHVLIVGSGPTGLTLAIELARRGVDLRIVERSPEYPAGIRGKGLQPRTLEVFDDLGVIDEILATGSLYPVIRSYQDGQVVWEGRLDEPKEASEGVPYPNLIMQPQFRTEAILRERLAELGHHVELGTEVTGFVQDEDGVTVTLNGSESVRCAYLVGADGGRSTVRKQLGVGFVGETFEEERMLLADVKVAGLDREYWHSWGDMAKQVLRGALCPLPGTDLFQLTTPFRSLEEFTDVAIDEVVWQSEYRVNIRMAERFRVGRVFLAGDAAHVHSPAGGQGLNTGVQDAYNLGWKLASGSEQLIGTYEFERMGVAEHVLGLSTRLLRTQELRRGEETNQLAIAYYGSPLAVGERGGERLGSHFKEQRGTGWLQVGDLLVRPDGYIGHQGDAASRQAYLAEFGITL
ncbi:MAG: hypothetical protein HOY71_23460 [Nonomuraea sp.]|nr:hypothetical protein [Nonomuraea sp.]